MPMTVDYDDAEDGQSSDSLAALLDRGAVLAEAEQWLEALRAFDAASRAAPTSARAHEQRAQVLLELGRGFDAIKAAEAACALKGAWGACRRTLARAQLNHGEVALALGSYEEAVMLLAADEEGEARECAEEAGRAEAILTVASVRQAMRDAGLVPSARLVDCMMPGPGLCAGGGGRAAGGAAEVRSYDPLDLRHQVFEG